jgi:endo-1,4-beta-xylanase
VSAAHVGHVPRARNLAEPPLTGVTVRNATRWSSMLARAFRDRVTVAEAVHTSLAATATAATRPAPLRGDAAGPLWAASSVPVGAAVDPDLLERDGTYAATLLREFNAITPENAMKWGLVHPSRHGWHFEPADRLVEFGEAHRLRVHGHALVWHRQLPRWLTWLSRREVVQVLASHVGILVGRYAGRIASWDVVNEAVADDGGLRDTCFLRTCGQDYIAEAFRLAHAADPRARLYYNDYGAEEGGRKSDAVYALLRRLLDDGVPVHGVGLQMHLRGTRPPEPAAIAASVARFLALGLEVRISEMDVRIRRVRRGDPLALQRLVYRDAIAACAAMPGFAGVTFWGMNDTHSWIHREFGKDAPLLFDGDYAPKPAYFGAREGLAAGRKATARSGPSVQTEKEPHQK